MSRHLPPFAALRAFEAVARRGGFAAAAEELLISRSAVSHQVLALERWVGTRLIRRGNGHPVPTATGQRYFDEIRAALDRIDAASARIAPQDPNGVTIAIFTSHASNWLVPMLSDFHANHPDVEIRLVTLFEHFSYVRDDVDIVVDYRAGKKTDYSCDLLLREHIYPVCSPTYLSDRTPISRIEDFQAHTLIYHASCPDEWRDWFRHAGAEPPAPAQWLRVDTQATALDAARNGLGIAMGRRPVVDRDVAHGRLMTPKDLVLDTGYSYFLVADPVVLERSSVMCFRNWLLSRM